MIVAVAVVVTGVAAVVNQAFPGEKAYSSALFRAAMENQDGLAVAVVVVTVVVVVVVVTVIAVEVVVVVVAVVVVVVVGGAMLGAMLMIVL